MAEKIRHIEGFKVEVLDDKENKDQIIGRVSSIGADFPFKKGISNQELEGKLTKYLKAIKRIDRITDDIYVGGVSSPEKIKLYGFKSVINLSGDYVEYKAENITLQDSSGNNPQKFVQAVKLIEEKVKNKETPIYVHCGVGFSRSITVVALYLYHNKEFESLDRAIDYVVSKRPEAYPNPSLLKEVKEKVLPLLEKSHIRK
jgi:rhodanese-related sulfurtransferase